MGLRDRLKSAIGLGPRTHLAPGVPAPALDVLDAEGRRWAWADLAGKATVVYFYPKDDTPGCTREACDFRDQHGKILGAGAQVFGVSTDAGASHQAFARKFQLPFPLLVDQGGALSQRWGVAGTPMSRRVTFLVDREGRIARVWDPVRVDGHVAEVVEALTQLG